MERPYRVGIVFLVTAVLGLLLDLHIRHLGDWVPKVPMNIGLWRGTDVKEDVTVGDHSRYISRIYLNPFGETVWTYIVAPQTLDSYRDPRGCMRGSGYVVTAERDVPLADTHVKLMVLRRDQERQIMCYWIQERGGRTRPEAPAFAYSRLARAVQTFRFAGQALLAPSPVCLVRVYSEINANDPEGQQTLRNVLRMSQQIHAALKGSH
jgi:hypothetical protein